MSVLRAPRCMYSTMYIDTGMYVDCVTVAWAFNVLTVADRIF